MNLFPQVEHSCGFSPLWILRWVFKELEVENPFSQMSQTCGLSPVWVLKWRFNNEGRSKHFPQKLQGNIFLEVDLEIRDFLASTGFGGDGGAWISSLELRPESLETEIRSSKDEKGDKFESVLEWVKGKDRSNGDSEKIGVMNSWFGGMPKIYLILGAYFLYSVFQMNLAENIIFQNRQFCTNGWFN